MSLCSEADSSIAQYAAEAAALKLVAQGIQDEIIALKGLISAAPELTSSEKSSLHSGYDIALANVEGLISSVGNWMTLSANVFQDTISLIKNT